MKLEEWLFKNQISAKAFSDTTGINYYTVLGLFSGTRTPRLHTALAIYWITEGEVAIEDMTIDRDKPVMEEYIEKKEEIQKLKRPR